MSIEVVRSEEELHLGVQRRAYERVVVRTKVVTEEVAVTVTVPIRRQVLEIQQIPLGAGAAGADAVAGAPGDVGPDVIEVVLHEERPVVEVVDVSVVPVERVRVIREARSVQVPVSAEVGREVVDIVTDVGTGAVAGPGTTVVPGSTPGS
jgi:stress response protein YsnF